MDSKMRGLPAEHYIDQEPDVQLLRRLDFESTVRGQTPAGRGALGAGTSPTLRARFFGRFELLRDGELVALGRNRKTLSILKYLVANHRRPVSQDHLMGWLWPESNLKKARWSLNSAVHGLRKLLSEDPSATVNYVVLEEGYYRLCSTIRMETDVDEFDARYEAGRLLEKTNQAREAAAEYEAAIDLYRGDYLVEDLYEDWTMVERERLANAYVDMLDRLARHYLKAGQHQESIRACYRLLQVDRSHEASYRTLMHCYVNLGLRGRALRHYRLCEEVLEQMYNTAPAPETKALHRSMNSGELPG